MVENAFGGPWTVRKLECLGNYLKSYRTIFTANPHARYFRTWYVDAFAGTGSFKTPQPKTTGSTLAGFFSEAYEGDQEAQTETREYHDGSAKIALSLASPFDNYLFIEDSKSRAATLQSSIEAEFPTLFPNCHFRIGDANHEIQKWCKERNWSKDRAVVFLDPFGMQVEWTTIEALAATKGVDLWYLFPGIARLLRHDGDIDERWKARLDLLLGTEEWRTRFFPIRKKWNLFGETEETERDATEDAIAEFIRERLATCFGGKVAKTLILRNSRRSPLYFLCFAAANERGSAAALRIANSILDE
jgi:three-Cys-motif partner protein